jgi:hypothetical protein
MTPIAAKGEVGKQAVWGATTLAGLTTFTLSDPAIFAPGDIVFGSATDGGIATAVGQVVTVGVGSIVVRSWGTAVPGIGGRVWRAAYLWRALSVPAGSDWDAGSDQGIEKLDTTGGAVYTRSRNAREAVRVMLGNVAVSDWTGWKSFVVNRASGGMGCFTGVWADKDAGGIRLAKVRLEVPTNELGAVTVGHGRRKFELAWEILEEGVFF